MLQKHFKKEFQKKQYVLTYQDGQNKPDGQKKRYTPIHHRQNGKSHQEKLRPAKDEKD